MSKFVAASDGTAKGLPYQQWCYLVRTKPPRAAVEELVQYIRSAPCIASVKLDSQIDERAYYVAMTVTAVDGERMIMVFTPMPGQKQPEHTGLVPRGTATSQSVASQAPTTMALSGESERSREWMSTIESMLRADNAIWFRGTTGLTLSVGAKAVASWLPLATETILSFKPKNQKIEILRRLGFFPGTEEFIGGFKASEQLAARLKALARERAIEPMTMEELEKSGLDVARGVFGKPVAHPESKPRSMSSGDLWKYGELRTTGQSPVSELAPAPAVLSVGRPRKSKGQSEPPDKQQ